MNKTLMVISLVFLFFISFGCKDNEAAEEPAVDIAAEEAAIREANTAWVNASNDKDLDAAMSLFADDYVRLMAGAIGMRDKAGEREMLADWYTQGWKSAWEPTKVIIAGSGDLAYAYGLYLNEREEEGELRQVQGGFLNVWKKQADGSWKIVALK